MKRMSKPDIKQAAQGKYNKFISYFGLRNAKMIVWQVYKMLRDEETRRKKLEKKK